MINMKYEITYKEENGLLYPDFVLPEQTHHPIGKYGSLRLAFIKEHRKGTYTTLLTQCRLNAYARLTAYFGILPTRSPILPERDLTPSSSARGTTLAVLASSVSRILPGQEYSIVTAIAAGVAYCNAPPLIPQGQKRKMFLTAEIFLKLFFDIETVTRLFTVGWRWLCFYDVKSINRNLSRPLRFYERHNCNKHDYKIYSAACPCSKRTHSFVHSAICND